MIITAREKDLGGFSVRRVLPYASHRMVGPFIFFDHMGPARFEAGKGLDVRPHPHIGLATVTYLFEGRIRHRDSLGSDQLIEPGAINWMVAGKGVVHSERSDEPDRARGAELNGIQLWVALPEEHEEQAASFSHHPKAEFTEISVGDARIKLLLGRAFGHESPVEIQSDLFYAEAQLAKGRAFLLSSEGRESALYLVDGSVEVNGVALEPEHMFVADGTEDLRVTASVNAHFMVLGGTPVGERFIFWNFVSSSKARLEEVKREWREGPRETSERFKPVPNDDTEFIPLPEDVKQPKGTIL